jgi:hypothetical protein
MTANHPSTLTAVASTPVLAALLMLFPAALIVTGPTTADQYSLIGALVAAAIALVAVRKYDQSLPNGVCVILASVICGICLPGALVSAAHYKGWIHDETYVFITWHIWMALGLVCGLSGWVVVQSLYQVLTKSIPGLFSKIGEKIDKIFQ